MTLERKQIPTPLTYELWKLQLRKDCEGLGKLAGFDAIGDYTLRLLFEDGVDPTVEAIVGNSRRMRAT